MVGAEEADGALARTAPDVLLLLHHQARRREDLQLDLVLEGMSVSHCLLEACVRRYHVL